MAPGVGEGEVGCAVSSDEMTTNTEGGQGDDMSKWGVEQVARFVAKVPTCQQYAKVRYICAYCKHCPLFQVKCTLCA